MKITQCMLITENSSIKFKLAFVECFKNLSMLHEIVSS